MILTAEYVSPGHPDRLCDAIVNNIVNYVVSKDKDALCGLECAVHTNKVFIDGRIAAGKKKTVITEETIKNIVRKVYKDARYGNNGIPNENYWFHPYPEELTIILDVCIEKLSDDERDLRKYSDDQNIVNGYASNSPATNYLPIAHYIALSIGENFFVNRVNNCSHWGSDFKVLVQLKKEQDALQWERLTLSVQHLRADFKIIYSNALNDIKRVLKDLFTNTSFNSLSTIDRDHFYLNGAGDFIQGGPEGDNGLSGKKLCIDFYGPSIPIGGGAIYGKDPHKIDVCGAFRARELAVNLVKKYGYYSVFTTLAWSPGEQSPYIIEAYEIDEFGTKFKIDDSLLPPRDFFSIECINNDMNLGERKITSIKDIK
ncbi:MAG: methionine adenosyltransferase domain-containing protein [Clostridia bacterium]|nr:methionine adenosyltransferase domain-containing protein [Clostridia bacterium]